VSAAVSSVLKMGRNLSYPVRALSGSVSDGCGVERVSRFESAGSCFKRSSNRNRNHLAPALWDRLLATIPAKTAVF
jgi:hypothetical protein